MRALSTCRGPICSRTDFARAAIDAGARIVVGHHPHVIQPWERYGGGVIFYSLGNLVFDQFQRVETQRGLLAEVVFAGRTLLQRGVMPVDIVQTVPRLSSVRRRSRELQWTAAAHPAHRNKSGSDG
jgi:poly-gamma-glutamate synthesis protein (capsule biosynthesis protein)